MRVEKGLMDATKTVPIWHYSGAGTPGERWAKLALQVEDPVYTTLLIPDRPLQERPSPMVALAFAAAKTTWLRLGTFDTFFTYLLSSALYAILSSTYHQEELITLYLYS